MSTLPPRPECAAPEDARWRCTLTVATPGVAGARLAAHAAICVENVLRRICAGCARVTARVVDCERPRWDVWLPLYV